MSGVRLFVGLRPPPGVVEALRSLDRPELPSLRWTTPDQWHVTLRFLGSVPEEEVAAVAARFSTLAGPRSCAVLGPATRRLGRSLLVAPVAGLDHLAAAVAAVVPPGPEAGRPFVGHLTLARARGRTSVPAGLVGTPVSARWAVGEVALVRSRLRPAGAEHDDVAVVALEVLEGP